MSPKPLPLDGKSVACRSLARSLGVLFALTLCATQLCQSFAAGPLPAFNYATLREKARALAAAEYHPDTRPELPETLKKLSYDDYQAIRFIPAQGPWQKENLRFTFQFFHRGFIYHDPVRIHLVEQNQVHDFLFNTNQFEYLKKGPEGALPADLSFAGLRVLYPLNLPGKQDEVAAFLGASYFRLIGAHQRYGASARGLAIDTGEPTGEEFPRFTDFWIEKPGVLDSSVRLYALLDSPSAAGAYQFVLQPGEISQMDVEASVFVRKDIKKLGVGALTSMFLMGENRTRFLPDFRPEVHDSDGLLLHMADPEWSWRPLVNPDKEHVVSDFPAAILKGFGLLQRDRLFDHYQDLAGRYEMRPSLWVEPRGALGTGTVELVEIPSPVEYNDNIVAYWVPAEKAARGQELHWTYRLSACESDPENTKLLRVEATRITPEHDKAPPRFVIDFGADPTNSPPATAPIETAIQASHGTIRNVVSEKNEVTSGWRSFFDLADAGNKPVELRLFLHIGKEPLSETWIYHYQPP
ncbi:MAG TPA: glucan biosynthesis protein [Verrucomicrobiae bacterium]|nr:glucan biosynthesis protein [Verrucomicrobiae bacterium]